MRYQSITLILTPIIGEIISQHQLIDDTTNTTPHHKLFFFRGCISCIIRNLENKSMENLWSNSNLTKNTKNIVIVISDIAKKIVLTGIYSTYNTYYEYSLTDYEGILHSSNNNRVRFLIPIQNFYFTF